MVLQLCKTLKGLKQSSHRLNKAFDGFFALLGLKPEEADHCVYFNASRTLFFMVHVDDLVLIGDLESVQSMKKKLNIPFEMSDLGSVSCFLRFAVTQDKNGLLQSQVLYAKEIL